jgi:hypothetical protein
MAATDPMKRAPATKPPFTLATLRKAIPSHCWERSVAKSFAWLALDLALMAMLVYASTFIDTTSRVPVWAKWAVLWPAYWWALGGCPRVLGRTCSAHGIISLILCLISLSCCRQRDVGRVGHR